MNDLVSVWRAEHANFVRLLGLLDQELAVFRSGEAPNYELMRDIVYYLRHYADEVHHKQEEIVFARLRERIPAMKPQIDRLSQDHRVISAAGELLLRHLEDVVRDALVPRSLVEAAAATYIPFYRRHLVTEDCEVIPLASDVLTDQDWEAVVAVSAKSDPLYGENVEARFRKLRRQIALEA